MQGLRVLFFLSSTALLVACFIYLSFASTASQGSQNGHSSRGSLRSLFSFHTPAILFSSSATISLTDDNSTFFAATPAAFGPLLSASGLSGEIWIGSGFGEDNLRRRGLAATVEGELGCNDIPGWLDRDWTAVGRDYTAETRNSMSGDGPSRSPSRKLHKRKSGENDRTTSSTADQSHQLIPTVNDGTDDNFHYPLPSTPIHWEQSTQRHVKEPTQEHADIQSIQESAEITGKVVLLSRGGCGFSEKVKWAQRRGGRAVIVGDNMRGEPLVRMYASGDTSNITIPSLFTSHTTAHLLSSLVPHGYDVDSQAGVDSLASNREGSDQTHARNNKQMASAHFDASDISKDRQKSSVSSQKAQIEKSPGSSLDEADKASAGKTSWLGSAFRVLQGASQNTEDSNGRGSNSKPPRSGNTQWVKVEDFDDEETWAKSKVRDSNAQKSGNDFVIGVHDWRDPDVVGMSDTDERTGEGATSTQNTAPTARLGKSVAGRPRGGIITPGSGEYEISNINAKQPSKKHAKHESAETATKQQHEKAHANVQNVNDQALSEVDNRIMPQDLASGSKSPLSSGATTDSVHGSSSDRPTIAGDPHEGLWVTLSLSSMTTHPFFNILFVLVVSPLITLAVVYTMLLIRSRVRQRRWRAPKSIVERLPVRVYQALSNRSSSNSNASSIDNVTPPAVSQTTPLLVPSRVGDSASRPRSRTVCGTSGSAPSSSRYGSLEHSMPEHEKSEGALSAWKRQYGGKQIECVVCLEEYVDGVSKVMSLPCGHEFHADCITPWLTTRRRTCPICKGDVVRSMDQRNHQISQEDSPPELNADDVQTQAAETTNQSPSASLPLPPAETDQSEDVERGDRLSRPTEPTQRTYWMTSAIRRSSESLSPLLGPTSNSDLRRESRSPSPDRNR
ncbi:MAG: hypothetical protein M1828_006995 [Chrysothrix sp. TS-e1954]|nr:MAG: hypothetical protein M1828_006995 [Chrysothrix sp. TS-e1954]